MSVPAHEWRTPSQAQPKDCFGNENRTRFRVRARLNDGHVVWCGWFDDRDDADAFLWALAMGSLQYERELWRLPSPWWSPDFGENLSYDFATVSFLTTPTGSNQTYTSPIDWNNSNNKIECLGSGASGGAINGTGHATGGGGASYAKITNFSFATPGTTTATYQIGTGGAGIAATASGSNGNASWFNNATDPGLGTDNSKCGAKGGTAGVQGAGSQNGGAGGVTTTSWGQTKNAGGRGGNLTGTSGTGGSGGGGAGGPNGAGNQGVDTATTATNINTNGGSADAGSGGAGGLGQSGSVGQPGGNGTEWDASHGSGGGGGGSSVSTNAGSGGNYGGGGGGVRSNAATTSGAGIQGIIVITYTPHSLPVFGNRRIFLTRRR